MITMVSLPSFHMDVLKLVSGTTIAQIIGIISYPIIARIYSPEAFGVYSLFLSIINIVGVISCMRYEFAIILPKSDEEAANILVLTLIISLIVSVLLLPVGYVIQQQIPHNSSVSIISPYLWLVPPTIFLNGVTLALTYWSMRERYLNQLGFIASNPRNIYEWPPGRDGFN